MERIREKAQTELDDMQAVLKPGEIGDEQLEELSALESFDKNKLKILIDQVIVYDKEAIEIMWKVENPFLTETIVG